MIMCRLARTSHFSGFGNSWLWVVMEWWLSWGKAKILWQNCSSTNSSTWNLTWSHLVWNSFLHCEKPARNYPSYGTGRTILVTNLYHFFNSLCFNNFPVQMDQLMRRQTFFVSTERCTPRMRMEWSASRYGEYC